MALVPCTRCGNPTSDRAATCPRCGEPAEIVLAQLSTSPAQFASQDSLAVRILRWCRQNPIATGTAIYLLLAVPLLLAAFFHPDDQTAASLASLAIFPGALFGVGFGIWRALPDATVSGKLHRVGWSALILLIAGAGIWLLSNFLFAWYLLGAAVIGSVCYLGYLAARTPSKQSAKSSNWYWAGVYLGAMLIGAVSMNAGSQAARRIPQVGQSQGQVQQSSNDETIVWRKAIEGALFLLGIYIIKQSSRAAVLAELSAKGWLSVESTQPSDPSASTVLHDSSLTSSHNSIP